MMIQIKNARMLTPDAEVLGSFITHDDTIADLGPQGSTGEDWEGDYLLPGLVEIHTDNVDRHYEPRPKTFWKNGLAAAMAHDAEIASAGITTCFDSLCIGFREGKEDGRTETLDDMLAGLLKGQQDGLFKVDHKMHFRIELTDAILGPKIEDLKDYPTLALISLMDHTPGQRQWRNLDLLRQYYAIGGMVPEDIEHDIQRRIELGSTYAPQNRAYVLDLFANRNLPVASHDDTTTAHVVEAADAGVTISEFPCSLDAAAKAKELGLYTVGGAPNICRGGSHSGNVSIMDMAKAGHLDGLSSDYVPSSLLQAVWIMAEALNQPLYEAIKNITQTPAQMVHLDDRGQLAVGKRADFLRVKVVDGTPLVREVYCAGKRVA